jgi:glycosyltransferase involved in cell wall biosynthesis
VKLTFVVQRYGHPIVGGTEAHARSMAQLLARRHAVDVMTTCALDYRDWKNHFPEGPARENDIPVVRFPVERPRSEREFALYSDIVFREAHSAADEREWVIRNGPYAPALIRALQERRDTDLFLFYSYRYYHTFFGLPRVADRAVLVPTAEDDPAVHLSIFRDLFRSPRGLLYLTPEERDLVQSVSENASIPSAVIGVGVELHRRSERVDVRFQHRLPPSFLLYVGRVDANKGVDRLLAYFKRAHADWPDTPTLVLAGPLALEIPEHSKIRYLGEVSDEEKYALIEACELLILPSPFESLSITILEAWAMKRPVLVNANARALEGQCLRSGGGLFYRGDAEFGAALRWLMERPEVRGKLGDAGYRYVGQEYDERVVEKRTEELLERALAASRSHSK